MTNFGAEVGIKTDERGGIVDLYSLNDSPLIIPSTNLKKFRIRTETGFGAEIRPIIGEDLTSTVGIDTSITKFTKIVDC